jgi:hypothetical protein
MKIKGMVYKLTAGASKHTLTERGIFARTFPLAIEQARKAGFKYLFAHCAIIQTKTICLKEGMTMLA